MSEGNVEGEVFFAASLEASESCDLNPDAAPVVAGSKHVSPKPHAAVRAVKRTLDLVGTVVLGIVFAPLIIAITCLLKHQGEKVLFRHRRIGLHGETFECLKFRTMIPDAERVLSAILAENPQLREEWLRDHKLKNDPRITPVGWFLRRTRLDELPQLWNVLRGDMSLVGPRPIVREELIRYGRMAAVYTSARPGLTGLWQVSGGDAIDYHRRVAMDVYYIRKRHLALDIYILFRTIGVVLGA
jgi:exopolysaccharide production protein ExoY